MKTKLSKIMPFFLTGLLSISTLALPVSALDCSDSGVPDEVKEAAGCNGGNTNAVPDVLTAILNSIILVSSLVAVIFIIMGGVKFMTSSGDPGKVKQAKDTILYAVIGLIVCALAFVIVNFVIKRIL
jgi:hypothetical protein